MDVYFTNIIDLSYEQIVKINKTISKKNIHQFYKNHSYDENFYCELDKFYKSKIISEVYIFSSFLDVMEKYNINIESKFMYLSDYFDINIKNIKIQFIYNKFISFFANFLLAILSIIIFKKRGVYYQQNLKDTVVIFDRYSKGMRGVKSSRNIVSVINLYRKLYDKNKTKNVSTVFSSIDVYQINIKNLVNAFFQSYLNMNKYFNGFNIRFFLIAYKFNILDNIFKNYKNVDLLFDDEYNPYTVARYYAAKKNNIRLIMYQHALYYNFSNMTDWLTYVYSDEYLYISPDCDFIRNKSIKSMYISLFRVKYKYTQYNNDGKILIAPLPQNAQKEVYSNFNKLYDYFANSQYMVDIQPKNQSDYESISKYIKNNKIINFNIIDIGTLYERNAAEYKFAILPNRTTASIELIKMGFVVCAINFSGNEIDIYKKFGLSYNVDDVINNNLDFNKLIKGSMEINKLLKEGII